MIVVEYSMKSKLIEEIIQYKHVENNKIGLFMVLFGVKPRVISNPLIQKYLTN